MFIVWHRKACFGFGLKGLPENQNYVLARETAACCNSNLPRLCTMQTFLSRADPRACPVFHVRAKCSDEFRVMSDLEGRLSAGPRLAAAVSAWLIYFSCYTSQQVQPPSNNPLRWAGGGGEGAPSCARTVRACTCCTVPPASCASQQRARSLSRYRGICWNFFPGADPSP